MASAHPLENLHETLLQLCQSNEAFYYVDCVRNGVAYRIFSYRLASYTDFQKPGAIECRGHTFRHSQDGWTLASLPPAKFFNYGEHVSWGHTIALENTSVIMDKADGSLISTVIDEHGNFFLKSKTSFGSVQAVSANRILKQNKSLWNATKLAVSNGYTVNFELVGPNNQIVVGYDTERLIVLNARHMTSGEYASYQQLVEWFGDSVATSYEIPADMHSFLHQISESTDNIEGIVFVCDGIFYKHKTNKYCVLHHLKDSINNARRLWEACVNETADDLRALFHDDPVSIAKIIDMEEKASKIYSHIHKVVHTFYNENKALDRKSYAILGTEKLAKEGVFSLAMNLYLNKPCDIKQYMIKNHKKFGISDDISDNIE